MSRKCPAQPIDWTASEFNDKGEAMKTIIMRDSSIQLEEVALPAPGPGQVLVKSLACGICGSDLHLLRHSQEVFDFYSEIGIVDAEVAGGGLVISLGHEYCAEIVAYGADTAQSLPVGARVTSVPFLLSPEGQAGVGVTPGIYGAYSEYFVLSEALLLPVPDGVDNDAVALTEPMAVGLHAVNHGAVQVEEVALVAGCGPIGLACIAALKRKGIETIIASDPDPRGRAMAEQFGAHHTVNPLDRDELALATEFAGGARVVIFECVGLPAMIPDFVRRVPEGACIVFTGLHTGEVAINPAHALVKQLNLKFSYYYTPEEFSESLEALSRGEIPWRSLVTGKVGIDGVSAAFEELMQAKDHIKVIVEPWREGKLEAAN